MKFDFLLGGPGWSFKLIQDLTKSLESAGYQKFQYIKTNFVLVIYGTKYVGMSMYNKIILQFNAT